LHLFADKLLTIQLAFSKKFETASHDLPALTLTQRLPRKEFKKPHFLKGEMAKEFFQK
jgi:hypothetical protein